MDWAKATTIRDKKHFKFYDLVRLILEILWYFNLPWSAVLTGQVASPRSQVYPSLLRPHTPTWGVDAASGRARATGTPPGREIKVIHMSSPSALLVLCEEFTNGNQRILFTKGQQMQGSGVSVVVLMNKLLNKQLPVIETLWPRPWRSRDFTVTLSVFYQRHFTWETLKPLWFYQPPGHRMARTLSVKLVGRLPGRRWLKIFINICLSFIFLSSTLGLRLNFILRWSTALTGAGYQSEKSGIL